MKYFELANNVDKTYTEANFKAFQKNCADLKNGIQSEELKNARERASAASVQGGMNLLMLTECHFNHNLGNAIGKPNSPHLGLHENGNARKSATSS